MKFRLRWNDQYDTEMGNVKRDQEDEGLPTRGVFSAATKNGGTQDVLVRHVEPVFGTMYVEVSPITVEEGSPEPETIPI